MSFIDLENKHFLILGIANKKSVAYHVAKELINCGAVLTLSVQSEAAKQKIEKFFPRSSFVICDVEKNEDLKKLEHAITTPLDGIVHSIAYANFDLSSGTLPRFRETSRKDFLQAIQISCWSLVEVSHVLKSKLKTNASVVTVSVSHPQMTSYGYMGPIKSALETTIAYLAKDYSEDSQVRFNAVGAGPLKTSASAGIPNYLENYLFAEELTLRKKNLETREVADTILFLLSPRSSGINAQTLRVDAGMNCNFFDQAVVKKATRPDL